MVSFVFAQSDKLSHIPPTKSVFINTDAFTCNIECMQGLLDDGQIFSFISNYNSSMEELYTMRSEFAYYQRIFRVFDDEEFSIRVAMLVPQKSIRRYASTTVNSVLAYLVSKQNNFEVKVFNSNDEKESSILRELKNIKNENFRYVIAPVTQNGAKIIMDNEHDLEVYIPTVHKKSMENNNSKIVFGGINYDKQIDELLKYSNSKIAYFSDGSNLSKSINDSLLEKNPKIVYSKSINSSRISFKRMFKNNKKLNDSSIFMNTPLVKTSLVASQIRVYDIEPYVLLSTQINYNPMLLTLTQYEDRKDFYIANSIGKTTVGMKELNSLFGHDIVYDWVNYSTSLGMDFFYTQYFVPTSSRNFSENIVENQVEYDITIVKPKRYKFVKELF
jgi:SRSO17 transposase